jgi:hypothetical protein
MLIVLMTIVFNVLWYRPIDLPMAATFFVYFILLTFEHKQFKYLYIILLLEQHT